MCAVVEFLFKPTLNAVLKAFNSQITREIALANCEATADEWLNAIQWQSAQHTALAFIEGYIAHQNKDAIKLQAKQAIVVFLMEQYDNGASITILTSNLVETLTKNTVTFNKNLTTVTLFAGGFL